MNVVVTGVGTLGAWGHGLAPLEEALRDGVCHAVEVPPHRHDGAHTAALVTDTDFSAYLPPLKARRMSPPSRMAVVAARMALEHAQLDPDDHETAVCLATAFGPTSYTEELLAQMEDEGPAEISPFLFSECVANVPAAQVAVAARAHGPNVTITQREAGPCLAVARGAALVSAGTVKRALVGSVDEMTPLTHCILDRFRALARPVARPFDARRNGYLPGEGATVLVLEREEDAQDRGLVRIGEAIRAADPTAPVYDWGTGADGLAAALRRGLRGDIDRVVSTASGSVRGDALEAGVLTRALDQLPPVLAPKAVTGEYGGGLLAAAVLAARGAPFGPTPGFESTDLKVRPHAGGALPAPRRTLVSGLAPAGAAAWFVLEAIA